MILLPIETEGHKEDAVIIVLDPSQIERLNMADPAEVVLRQTGKHLVNPTIQICLERPSKEWTRILQSGDLKAILKFLGRGFKFRPDKGDHDRGPESLRDMQ